MKVNKEKLIKIVKDFNKANILVIGDIMLDKFIWGKVERISPEAPVPVVEVQRESIMPGGAANVVNNISALGGKSFLSGIIGEDNSGKEILKILKDDSINFFYTYQEKSRPTIVKTRIIAHNQQVVRVDRESKHLISNKTADKILEKLKNVLPEINLICFSDYNKGLATDYFVNNLMSLTLKFNKKLIVDPKPANIYKFKNSFLLTPNQMEAAKSLNKEFLSEENVLTGGAELLKKLNANYLLITRGGKGMSLFSKNERPYTVPAITTEVYDVTGAGDTVLSVLSLALSISSDIKLAILLANFAASVVVRKIGTATCSQEDLIKVIKEYKS